MEVLEDDLVTSMSTVGVMETPPGKAALDSLSTVAMSVCFIWVPLAIKPIGLGDTAAEVAPIIRNVYVAT